MINTKKYVWWIMAVILTIASVFVAVESSTSGFEIAKLEKEANLLTQENRELSDNLVSGMSLNSIAVKSQEFGFDKPEKVVYVSQEQKVAKLP